MDTAHRAAVKGVATRGCHQHRIHIERRRTAKRRPHIRVVHDALEHRNAPCIREQLLDQGSGRRIAHSTPRVSVKPVSFASSALSPVYTGISLPVIRAACSTSGATASSQRRSMRNDSACMPASSARAMTFGDSAMKMPRAGSSLLRNCRSVKLTYAATRSSSMPVMFTMPTIPLDLDDIPGAVNKRHPCKCADIRLQGIRYRTALKPPNAVFYVCGYAK